MKYQFSEEDYIIIKKARKKNRDKQLDKRLEVLELRCKGKTQKEISEKTGFHRSHVSNLIRKYFDEGLSSVAEKHYTGNRRNMSYAEEEELLAPFDEQLWNGEPVRVPDIKKAYQAAVGHSIGTSQIYYVLQRHKRWNTKPRQKKQ